MKFISLSNYMKETGWRHVVINTIEEGKWFLIISRCFRIEVVGRTNYNCEQQHILVHFKLYSIKAFCDLVLLSRPSDHGTCHHHLFLCTSPALSAFLTLYIKLICLLPVGFFPRAINISPLIFFQLVALAWAYLLFTQKTNYFI